MQSPATSPQTRISSSTLSTPAYALEAQVTDGFKLLPPSTYDFLGPAPAQTILPSQRAKMSRSGIMRIRLSNEMANAAASTGSNSSEEALLTSTERLMFEPSPMMRTSGSTVTVGGALGDTAGSVDAFADFMWAEGGVAPQSS